jgi:hypothetical protein
MAKTTTTRDAVSKEAKPKEPRRMWTDIFAKNSFGLATKVKVINPLTFIQGGLI